jgi:preprotein translocase subunit SecY
LSELTRRIAFTLGALLVYHLGTYIPLPGFDTSALSPIILGQTTGWASTSSQPHLVAIFSLGVLPYIWAAIIVQLAMLLSRRLRAVRKRGAHGRAIVERWTRYLTVLLAALQSLVLAKAFMAVADLVTDPGWLFVITTTVTLTAGTMFLVWLSAQITVRGVGNGLALLLLAGVAINLPDAVAQTLEFARLGVLSRGGFLLLAVIVVAVVALVVLVERGRRHIPIRYPQRQVGAVMLPDRTAPLTLKLNNAGIIPVVLAPWPLVAPIWLIGVAPPSFADMLAQLLFGYQLYWIFFVLLIVLFAFLYTAFVVDPDEGAGSLRQLGGAVAGVEPGDATAEFVDRVVSRLTVIGAVYLAAVSLLPEIVIAVLGVLPFSFGGPSLLLVVCTMLDLADELRAYAIGPGHVQAAPGFTRAI